MLSSSLPFLKCICELTVSDISVAGVSQWNLVFRKQELSVNLLSIVISVHSAVVWSRLWLYFLFVLISLYDKSEQETCWSCSQYLWLLNQTVDISLTWIFPADIPWGNISVKSDRVPEWCHSTFGQHHVTWSEQACWYQHATLLQTGFNVGDGDRRAFVQAAVGALNGSTNPADGHVITQHTHTLTDS